MSKLTLDEAIKHCEEQVAKYERQCEYGVSKEGKEYNSQCAADHRQLAEWLRELQELRDKHWDECRQIAHYDDELKEAKRLLKAAVDGFEYIKPYTSRCDGHCDNCPFENEGWCRINWKYTDEALKLIGGSENDRPEI